jgi:GT2 family glycosyltransferase
VNDELVICTKDRLQELSVALEAVSMQVSLPVRVLVIDASQARESEALVESIQERYPTRLEYRRIAPGLTHQRNAALGMLLDQTEVVHFIDDDAVPSASYVCEMRAVFQQQQTAGGVCGFIDNLPELRTRRLYLWLGFQGAEGSLLSTGVNMLNFSGVRVRSTSWLSGCSMSYRVSAIAGLQFDERRTGNGLGEDVDFSARVAASHDLFWTPHAKITHNPSPVNRDSVYRWCRASVVHRWTLAADGVGPVRKMTVLSYTAAQIALSIVKAVRSGSRHDFEVAWAYAAGIFDVANGKVWRA